MIEGMEGVLCKSKYGTEVEGHRRYNRKAFGVRQQSPTHYIQQWGRQVAIKNCGR